MATGVGGGDDLSHSQLNAGDELFSRCCTPCQKRNKNRAALKYCPVCLEYMCTECVDNHNSFQALSIHTLVDVTRVQVLSGNARTRDQLLSVPTEMCKNHPMKVMDMYCEDDDCVGCSVCIAPHYKSCSGIHYIPEYVKSVALDALNNQTATDLHACINSVSALKTLQNDLKKNLDSDKAECKQKIKGYSTEIKKVVDQLEQASLKELDEAYRTVDAEIKKRIKNIEDMETELARLKREIEITHDNDSQKFAITKVAQEMITESVKLSSALNTAEAITVHFDENITILQQLQQYDSLQKELLKEGSIPHTPGNATSSSLPKVTQSIFSSSKKPLNLSPTSQSATIQKSTTLQHPDKLKPSSLQTPNKTNKGPVKREVPAKRGIRTPTTITDTNWPIDTTAQCSSDTNIYTLASVYKCCVRIPNDHETCKIDSICLLDDGNLIMVDSSNNALKLFDMNTYEVTDSITLSNKPSRVYNANNEKVAVSLLGNAILLVSTKDKLSPIRKITTNCSCYGLVVIEDTLYICDADYSVHVYKINGEFLKTMRYRSTKGSHLNCAYNDMTLSSDKKTLFTCDSIGVSALDLEGNVIWQHKNEDDAHIKGPTAVCCDGEGHLFVSGYVSRSVVLVNQKNGAYIEQIGKWRYGATYPTEVCYVKGKQELIVCMYSCDEIWVLPLKRQV